MESPTCRIFVRFNKSNLSKAELREIFEKHGNIIDLNRLAKFCFIEYESHSSAEAAVQAENGALYNNSPLEVEFAVRSISKRNTEDEATKAAGAGDAEQPEEPPEKKLKVDSAESIPEVKPDVSQCEKQTETKISHEHKADDDDDCVITDEYHVPVSSSAPARKPDGFHAPPAKSVPTPKGPTSSSASAKRPDDSRHSAKNKLTTEPSSVREKSNDWSKRHHHSGAHSPQNFNKKGRLSEAGSEKAPIKSSDFRKGDGDRASENGTKSRTTDGFKSKEHPPDVKDHHLMSSNASNVLPLTNSHIRDARVTDSSDYWRGKSNSASDYSQYYYSRGDQQSHMSSYSAGGASMELSRMKQPDVHFNTSNYSEENLNRSDLRELDSRRDSVSYNARLAASSKDSRVQESNLWSSSVGDSRLGFSTEKVLVEPKKVGYMDSYGTDAHYQSRVSELQSTMYRDPPRGSSAGRVSAEPKKAAYLDNHYANTYPREYPRDGSGSLYGKSQSHQQTDPAADSSGICEIIITEPQLRHYALKVASKIHSTGLKVEICDLPPGMTVLEEVEDAMGRRCLFAIIVTNLHYEHNSVTVDVLHGVPEEHRNMIIEDAVQLIAESYRKYLGVKDEPKAIHPKSTNIVQGPVVDTTRTSQVPGDRVQKLIDSLARNTYLSYDELEELIIYLRQRQESLRKQPNAMTASSTPLNRNSVESQNFEQDDVTKKQKEIQATIFSILKGGIPGQQQDSLSARAQPSYQPIDRSGKLT